MTAGVGLHPADWTLAAGAQVRCTGWAQGDMARGSAAVDTRRRSMVDLPWTVLRQVHGSRVALVAGPGAASGEEADAAVTACQGAALAVLTADCAPVALASGEGIIGIAHAGWRGLRAGVIEATVHTMRRLGATEIEAVLGPCIHPCCYPFAPEDLERVVERFGDVVRAEDSCGDPALDLPAGVFAALHTVGVTLAGDADTCTGCSGQYWSWRTDGTERRQATVVWRS